MNDNRAVFRSRLLLDKDQSTRNYNLARAYSQLGLGEWATGKAVTAVKLDPLNASPHLFLARAYEASNQRIIAVNSEDLLYRVLSPANQTTFRYILENDYTTMIEMPYARATVQGGVGAWQERKTIHDDFVAGYGGIPGAAAFGRGDFSFDPGFRGHNTDDQIWNAEGIFKWEPTVYGNATGYVQYRNELFGDTSFGNDFFHQNLPNLRENNRFQAYELSYLHHFTPNLSFLAFGNFHRIDDEIYVNDLYYFNDLDRLNSVLSRSIIFDKYNRYNSNVQLQAQMIMGKHTLLAGYDYFCGPVHRSVKSLDFLIFSVDPVTPSTVMPLGSTYSFVGPVDRTYTLYLQDYWRVAPWMVAELGVFREVARNAYQDDFRTVNNSHVEPAARPQCFPGTQTHPAPGPDALPGHPRGAHPPAHFRGGGRLPLGGGCRAGLGGAAGRGRLGGPMG